MNKSVLKKLFSEKEQSVELSEMNIHLESIGDYEKAVDSIIDIYGRNSNRIKDTSSIFKSAINDLDMGIKLAEKYINIGLNIEKQAKDLGIDMPGKYKSIKDTHLLELDRMKKLKNNLVRIESEVKSN